MRLETSKIDNTEFRKKTMTKWKPNLKSLKSQSVSSNWKVITIMKIGDNVFKNYNSNNGIN